MSADLTAAIRVDGTIQNIDSLLTRVKRWTDERALKDKQKKHVS